MFTLMNLQTTHAMVPTSYTHKQTMFTTVVLKIRTARSELSSVFICQTKSYIFAVLCLFVSVCFVYSS